MRNVIKIYTFNPIQIFSTGFNLPQVKWNLIPSIKSLLKSSSTENIFLALALENCAIADISKFCALAQLCLISNHFMINAPII